MDAEQSETVVHRILVVDDESGIRKLVARRLKRSGFEVQEAEDGQQALAVWDASPNPFDLLLTDLHMPNGLNGLELARKLQSHRPELKIVFMTGYSDDLLSDTKTHVENVDYLNKPFQIDTLLKVLRQRLDSSHLGLE